MVKKLNLKILRDRLVFVFVLIVALFSAVFVAYHPMAHGIQKTPTQRIIRYVTITSNDPVNFQEKIRIELTQVRKGDIENA